MEVLRPLLWLTHGDFVSIWLVTSSAYYVIFTNILGSNLPVVIYSRIHIPTSLKKPHDVNYHNMTMIYSTQQNNVSDKHIVTFRQQDTNYTYSPRWLNNTRSTTQSSFGVLTLLLKNKSTEQSNQVLMLWFLVTELANHCVPVRWHYREHCSPNKITSLITLRIRMGWFFSFFWTLIRFTLG